MTIPAETVNLAREPQGATEDAQLSAQHGGGRCNDFFVDPQPLVIFLSTLGLGVLKPELHKHIIPPLPRKKQRLTWQNSGEGGPWIAKKFKKASQ